MGIELFFICQRCSKNFPNPAALSSHLEWHKQSEKTAKSEKKESIIEEPKRKRRGRPKKQKSE